MRITLLLLVLALSFLALALSLNPRSSAKTLETRCSSAKGLQLDLERVIPTPYTISPLDFARITDTTFLALTRAGEIHILRSGESKAKSLGKTVMNGIEAGHGQLLAFTDQQFYRFDESVGKWRLFNIPVNRDRIRAAESSPSGSVLWTITSGGGQYVVRGFRITPQTEFKAEETQHWGFPRAVRMTSVSNERLVVASVRPPFQIQELTFGSDPVEMTEVTIEEIENRTAGTILATNLVTLDCNSVVLILAELESNTRWITVIDMHIGRIKSQVRVKATMSFFDSDPKNRRLFSYHETNRGGEVLVYRWTWISKSVGEMQTDAKRREP